MASIVSSGEVVSPGPARVLKLVAPSPQRAEEPEPVAELSPQSERDGVVAPAGGGSQALLRQQRGDGVTRRVVGQDKCAVRIVVHDVGSSRQGSRCSLEEVLALGRPSPSAAAARQEPFDLGLTHCPRAHRLVTCSW
jgi:hypothetical protein